MGIPSSLLGRLFIKAMLENNRPNKDLENSSLKSMNSNPVA